MARVSRKAQSVPSINQKRCWKAALYVRLSIEDNGIQKGESIDNQLGLLLNFVKKLEDVIIVQTYIDNGETGTDFERPEWEKLIDEVKCKKINCIVVKDLSRFARNYIEAGDYLEKIFPFLDVRFIAVNDCYDSSNLLFKENELTVSLKNVINDYYAKDISNKIMSSFRTKKDNGEFIGCKAPYGYLLKDNHFILDKEAADVVKMIFELTLQKNSAYAIAKILNEKQILSPSAYACKKGVKKYRNSQNIIWQAQAVTRILYNETYTGNLVQEKTNKSIYTNEKVGLRSEEKWLITPNVHEAIIDRKTFEEVQKIRQKNREIRKKRFEREKKDVKENILKGYIFCGICGKPIRRNSTVRRGKAEYCFYCATNYIHKNAKCTTASIVEHKVLEAAFKHIEIQIELVLEVDFLLKQVKFSLLKSKKYQCLCEEIYQNRNELMRITVLKNSIYEDYRSGILTKEEYFFAKEQYVHQIIELNSNIEKNEKKRKFYEESYIDRNMWIQKFKKFKGEKELTREMVVELIEKIELFPDRRIQITFQFAEEYEKIMQSIGDSIEKQKEENIDGEILSCIS